MFLEFLTKNVNSAKKKLQLPFRSFLALPDLTNFFLFPNFRRLQEVRRAPPAEVPRRGVRLRAGEETVKEAGGKTPKGKN